MIRTETIACSWLFTLLLNFLEEEKLVSGFDLVPFYFFLILFLWQLYPAGSCSAGHLDVALLLLACWPTSTCS
jgi:hypothetical protein